MVRGVERSHTSLIRTDPNPGASSMSLHIPTRFDLDDRDVLGAAPVRSRRSRDWMVVVLLAIGLSARMWMATTTDNADARTLAWGSSLVATGSADPYRDIVKDSSGDPIPLGGIRSLSLAQGYVGVTAGAIPMWVGDQLGLIHLGAHPDGHRFHLGELFAYKISYLIPEAGIVLAIALLVRERRSRMVALALWATTPLAFFTWGQGMPDTWTVMFVLLAAVLFRAVERAEDVGVAVRRYWALAATVALGALGTKLIPIVMLIPFVVVALRDRRLRPAQRGTVLAALPTMLGLFALPYLASPFMVTNVFVRFEFDMLFNGPGITTVGGLSAAQFGLMGLIAVTVWLVVAKNPWPRVEPWIIISLLAVTTTSGIIPHLMFWAVASIVLLCNSSTLAAAVVSAVTGIGAAWHLLTDDWLTGVVPFSISRKLKPGPIAEWVGTHVPFPGVIGGFIASALILGAGFAAWTLLRRSRGDETPPVRIRVALGAGGVVWMTLVACMVTAGSVAMSNPGPVWDLAYGTTGAPDGLDLVRGTAWTSAPIDQDLTVDALSFQINKESQPNLDDLRFSLVRNRETIGSVAIASWQAEPESDRGPVVLRFEHPLAVKGAVLRIERVTTVDPATENRAHIAGTDTSAWPLLRLEGGARSDGSVQPRVQLRAAPSRDFTNLLILHLLDPARVLLVPASALTLALAASSLPRKFPSHRRKKLS